MNEPEVTVEEKTPPYCAWGTFETCLEHLRAVGIPNVIDRNALPPSLSGGSKYEILGAFKSLGLTDKSGRPDAERLVRLIDPETRKESMVKILEEKYAGLFALPLSTAGPTEINRWFSENATSSTAQRAKAFFIRAAKANAVPMHSLVAKGARGSSGGIKRKKNGRRGGRSTETVAPPVDTVDKVSTNGSTGATMVDKLLAKFPDFNPEWSAEVQAKWFEGFAKLQDQLK